MVKFNEANSVITKSRLNPPIVGDTLPRRGNRLSQSLGKTILTTFGWCFEGQIPNLPKLVIIAAPHTSNWDFLLGITVIFAIGIHVSWMGKDTFVDGPFSRLLRWLGGVSINRRASHGVVEQMVSEFKQRDAFLLGLAPEGTRKKVSAWKTGFYHIACGAGVPVVPIAFDYGRRIVKIGAPLWPSGDFPADMAAIEAFYEGVTGKNPHQF